jgi:hypothetical protein
MATWLHVRGTGMTEMESMDHVCSRHSFDKRYLDDDVSDLETTAGWSSGPLSNAAPSALSWSAQNAPAKEGRPIIAAACCLRGASTSSTGCNPLEARARAHSENNSVFHYVFFGPEADFGRWPRDPRGGSRGGIAG